MKSECNNMHGERIKKYIYIYIYIYIYTGHFAELLNFKTCDTYMIYLLTAVGLTPDDSSTVHIYTQTIYNTTQITTEQHKKLIWKSAGRASSLRVLPWHLPYN